MKCPSCGSRDIDFQEAGGQSICVNCGTVIEESTIVSSIEFQETGDRSHVIGQFVAANCSKPYMSGSRLMGRHLDNRDSRETTLLNARRVLSQIASTLRLPAIFVDRAHRLYQLALQRNYNVGRRQANVLATCLYVICRQEKSPHLLIDFADALQVNVYQLGKAFLHFTKIIHINLDVIDPSLYIHRYADKLDLGDKMHSVVTASLRIITRLKKDWIATGRRPDGVCAAALLISARAHEFYVPQDTIAQLFRIALETVRKRITEFKYTPSAQLSLQQFFHVDIDASVEFDPPAFIRNRLLDVNEADGEIVLQLGATDNNNNNNDDNDDDEVGGNGPINPYDLAKDDVYHRAGGMVSESEYEAEDNNNSDSDNNNNKKNKNNNNSINSANKRAKRHALKQQQQKQAQAQGKAGGAVAYQLGDVQVAVPVPTLQRRQKNSESAVARHQDSAALYEDLYSDVFNAVIPGCDSQSQQQQDAVREALRRESEEVEQDALRVLQEQQHAVINGQRKRSRLRDPQMIIPVDIQHNDDNTHTLASSSLASSSLASSSAAAAAHVHVKTKRPRIIYADKPSAVYDDPRRVMTEDGDCTALLTEEDLEHLFLSPEESEKRAILFNQAYGEFLEQRAQKRRARESAAAAQDTDRYTQTGKLRKKYVRKTSSSGGGGGGSSAGHSSGGGVTGVGNNNAGGAVTTSQAALQASRAAVRGSSKKINYEALQGVFGEDGSFKVPEMPISAASAMGSAASSSSSSSSVFPMAGIGLGGGAKVLPSGQPISTAATKSRIMPGASLSSAPQPRQPLPPRLLQQQQQQQLRQAGPPGSAAPSQPNAAASASSSTTAAAANATSAAQPQAVDDEGFEEDEEFIDEPYGYAEDDYDDYA